MSLSAADAGYMAAGVLVLTAVVGLVVGLVMHHARRVQQALRREQQALDTALNNMSHGLCVFDAAGVLQLFNTRYLEVFGIPDGLVKVGCALRQLLAHLERAGIISGDQDRYAAELIAAMGAGQRTQAHRALNDGRTVLITNRPLPGGGWVGTHEDITDRVRAERQVREANAYLHDVIEALPAGLILYDHEDRFVLCNKRFDAIYHKTADLRVPGMRFEDILRVGLARGVYNEAEGRDEAWLKERVAAHHRPASVYEQRHANGQWVRIEDSLTSNGGHIGIRVDITELKQREEQLRIENIKLDAAMQNMSQGLVMFDHDGRLIVCNQRYAELYRLPPDLTRPGVSQKDTLAYLIAAGLLADAGSVQFMKDRAVAGAPHTPSETVLTLSDGRTLLVALRPLQNGAWVSTHEDITARREAEAQIAHMAHHDALTGLPNRVLLRERLDAALAHAERGQQIAVLYLDLDHFKSINDTLGHGVGDELLKEVAARLCACLGETDTIARLGGDEFAVIQTAIASPSDVAGLAARIRDALTTPYDLDGHQVPADVSIGISLAPDDTLDPDQLLKNADMALYRSKADGRGTYRFFEAQMDERVRARRALELDLRNALTNGEFELYFQPVVNLERNEISACETLLRWHHPTRGMVPPIEFIPVAEETGLINQIGEWVLRQACLEAATWPTNIAVAVNLSPVQFKNQNLALLIVSALGDSGLAAGRLELEITEAVLLQNNEATLATLHRIRELGARIAMDDFGTGYSSLSYLRSFPFDKIKIDRSFINDIDEKDESGAIVQAVTSLASRLKIVTTAEGVETQAQLRMIQDLGCTEMQGYFYSRPVPAKELTRLFTPAPGAAGSAA